MKLLPPTNRPYCDVLFSHLLGSRADSTIKNYINEIRKFFLWCKDNQITLWIPFSSPVVSLYLFNLDRQLRTLASMVLTHAALKWLHSLVTELEFGQSCAVLENFGLLLLVLVFD